jgi:hypothetical protein
MKTLWILLLSLSPLAAHAESWNKLLRSVESKSYQNENACSQTEEVAAPAVDLCNHPAETVCNQFAESSSEAIQNQIRRTVATSPAGDAFDLQFKKVSDLSTRLDQAGDEPSKAMTRRMLFPEQKAQLALIGKVEKNVLTKFHKTPADFDRFFESIRKSLMDKVSNSPEFARASGADGIVPSKADVLRKLSKVKIQTSQSMASAPNPTTPQEYTNRVDDANGYFDACSADGLAANAYYDPPSNTLKVCPGLLLQYLNDSGEKLEPLAFVLGHELGHAIDTDAAVPIQNETALKAQFPNAPVQTSSIMCYVGFLDCMDTKYVTPNQEKFGTYSQVINQLESRGIPALRQELTRVQSASPVMLDDVARVKRSITHNEGVLKDYKAAKAELVARGIDPDTVMIVQKNEMTADLMGDLAFKDQLKSLPQSARKESTINALRVYCETPEQKRIIDMAWGSANDAVHPPNNFRIEMLLRNPEVRGLLQCTPLQTPRPWCDLNNS